MVIKNLNSGGRPRFESWLYRFPAVSLGKFINLSMAQLSELKNEQ